MLVVPEIYWNLEEKILKDENFDDRLGEWLLIKVRSFVFDADQEEITIKTYRLMKFENTTIEIAIEFDHPELLSLDMT